ncbi:MAG: translocation/assembly module TamB domain-containing protein [Steroidobacteraceae bacterium]|nr:translocation/assembly module TamB domain-containing protein [Steroidobacteraceae bacterium]
MTRARLALVVLGALALLLLALAGAVAWLLGTEAGLHRVLAAVEQAGPVTIRAEGARGSLAGPLAIDRLSIEHERVAITVSGLRADLRLRTLPYALVRLDYVELDDVRVQVRERTEPPKDEPPRFLPKWLRLAVDRFVVKRVDVRTPSGAGVEMRDVGGRLAMTSSRLRVGGARADGGAWAVTGDALLLAADPLGLQADVQWLVRAGERTFTGAAQTSGDLEALQVDATTTRPRGASYAGRVRLVDGFAVDGRLALARFEPAALGAGAAFGAVDGALALQGTLDAFVAKGRLASSELPLGPVDLLLEGGYGERRLAVRRLDTALVESGAAVTARGELRLPDDATPVRIDLAGEWQGLRWPLRGGPATVASPAGRFTFAGGPVYDYTVAAGVRGPALPPAEVEARGTLTADELVLAAIDARLLKGRVEGHGRVSWRDAQPWSVALRGRGLDPGGVRDALAGRVNVQLAASGRGFAPQGHWDARIARLDGRVRGLPATGAGRLRMRGGELQVDGLEVSFGTAQLEANGVIGRRSDLAWRVRVDDLAAFVPEAAGSVRSRGSVVGDRGRRALQGTVGARGLRLHDWQVGQLVADVDLDTEDREQSYLRISARAVGREGALADTLRITLDGRAADHRLVVRGTVGDDWAELVGRGRYEVPTGAWTLRLEDLRVQGPPLWSYRLESPSELRVARAAMQVAATCFVRDGERICVAGNWAASAPWALTAQASRLPLGLLPLRLPDGTEYRGWFGAEAVVRGAPDEAVTGEGAVELSEAEFRYRAPSGRLETVQVGNGRLEARMAPDAWTASVGVATVGGSFVAGSARVERTGSEFAQSPLDAQLTFVTRELGWLPLFAPEVDRFTGQVEARLALTGRAGSPEVAGFVTFADGEIDVYRTNLLLRDVQARLDFEGSAVALDARAATKGGSARAQGRIAWTDRAPNGELHFVGEKLLVADLPEARVIASPDLRFTLAGRRLDVDGEVRVPFARIAPKDLRGAVLPSGDERIVGAETDDGSAAFDVHTRVRIVLDEKEVELDAYGLKGDLGGSLLVRSTPGEVATGTGELVVREGTYTAFTRELEIERGRLLFAGQSLGNPGLDVRAQRKIVSTTAGVHVRGTLLRPQITFYSDPPMSQSQIASMIIVGRTLDDVQDADRSAVGGADTRNALVAQGSALLAGQLGRTLGIEAGVETDAEAGTSVVIGRFLSPRLYVSYGVSLTETINTLKLRYTIGDNWVIRTESGVRQSADIEYTVER